MEWYWSALAYTSPTVSDKIDKATTTSSISAAFAPESTLNVLINRLIQTILFDHTSMSGNVAHCLEKCSRLGPTVRGAMIERVLETLSDAAYRPEIAEICISMGDVLLDVYKADKTPIRRLR